jgi:signal transduction histidine kinase
LIHRYERAGYATVVGIYGRPSDEFWVGRRWEVDGRGVAAAVRRTELPVRFDAFATAGATIAAEARRTGIRSGIGCPIFVDERLWGVIVASTSRADPLPPGSEARIAEFTELIATAISSVQARSDLAASRARLVAAADEERRQVVRDLHDGAQQRLVHTVVTLKMARRALERDRQGARALLDEARQHAQTATDELRDLAQGILPPVLIQGGLSAGLKSFSSAMSIPVGIEASVGRLPGPIEATAYFIVAEALTNVAKHSHARQATVTVRLEDHTLHVEVSDDGVGGARPEGSGLVGIRDRLAAIDGTLRIETPSGGGTVIVASIPVRESDVSASERHDDQAATVLGDSSRRPRSAELSNDARSAPSP